MRPLVFWQNIPSIHQAPLARALAQCWDGPVLVVTEEDIPERRLNQGWLPPTFEPAELLVAPGRATRRRLIARLAKRRAVHVFSGLRAYPETVWTLKRVAKTDGLIGVFLEPLREDDPLGSILRALIYRCLALRWRRRVDFLLVSGRAGLDRYETLGFHGACMFPFCYAVRQGTSSSVGPDMLKCDHPEYVRVLFAGQLIQLKGVHLLLEALGAIENRRWTLDVIGSGPQERDLKAQSEKLELSERIRWRGPLDNDETILHMTTADVVILPSLYDGWGAVVNEALAAGARVLVSQACGAADLATQSPTGQTFPAGSATALAEELERLIDLGPVLDAERSRTKGWADDAIAPTALARYLMDIVGFVEGIRARPAAPWTSAPVRKA